MRKVFALAALAAVLLAGCRKDEEILSPVRAQSGASGDSSLLAMRGTTLVRRLNHETPTVQGYVLNTDPFFSGGEDPGLVYMQNWTESLSGLGDGDTLLLQIDVLTGPFTDEAPVLVQFETGGFQLSVRDTVWGEGQVVVLKRKTVVVTKN